MSIEIIRLIANEISCIRQIPEKTRHYNGTSTSAGYKLHESVRFTRRLIRYSHLIL
jgi:hypothetical protein